MPHLRRLLAAILITAATSAPAATTDAGTFDVYLGGIRAGVMGFSGVEDGGRYTAAAEFRASGLLRLLREMGFDARSTGRVTSSGYVPIRYQEAANTGERVSRAVMDYVGGVPQLKVYEPPQDRSKRDLDPSTQGGTLDPMTTIYALLRDVDRGEACALDVFMFDGKRRSRVTARRAEPEGDGILCHGEYRRVGGFSKRQMEEMSVFPFRISYAPAGEGKLRVTRVVFDTLYGKANFVRR